MRVAESPNFVVTRHCPLCRRAEMLKIMKDVDADDLIYLKQSSQIPTAPVSKPFIRVASSGVVW
jgi:glutaredoxin 2